MGRYLKNVELAQGNAESVGVPTGTTAQRSSNPQAGDIRFNIDLNKLEIYNGSSFSTIATEGTASITQDSFTGDGTTTAFTMSTSVTNDQTQRVIVAVGNVYQNPANAYTLSGTTITFTSPPGNAETITVLHGYDSTIAS